MVFKQQQQQQQQHVKPEANKTNIKHKAKRRKKIGKTKKEELFQKGLAKNKGKRDDEGREGERRGEKKKKKKKKKRMKKITRMRRRGTKKNTYQKGGFGGRGFGGEKVKTL